MWMLRIDMTDRTYRLEEVPEAYRLLGGRGLTIDHCLDEVPPRASAGAQQQARLCAGLRHRHVRAHVGPCSRSAPSRR